MALPWVRLDSTFPMNPKVLSLVEDRRWQAIACYVSSLAYSGGQGTDGFIPSTCLPFVHGTPKIAEQLATVGLWVPFPGGWNINGWAEFQLSSEEHEARRKRAQAAAEIRWHGSRSRNAT